MFEEGDYGQVIIRSSIKFAFRLLILWAVRTVLLVFPGKTMIIQGIPLTFEFLMNIIFGLMLIIIVLRFRFDIANPLRNILPKSLVNNVVISLMYVAIIWVAYYYFNPVFEEVLPDFIWIFSLVLFAAAILPVAKISVFFYKSIDKLTDLLSINLYKIWMRTRKPRNNYENGEEKDQVCSCCGEPIRHNSNYCWKCGSELKREIHSYTQAQI